VTLANYLFNSGCDISKSGAFHAGVANFAQMYF